MKPKSSSLKDYHFKRSILILFFFELAVLVILSTLSDPVVERLGSIFPDVFPLKQLDPSRHTARTIMLYHSLAIPFVVITAFLFLLKYAKRDALANQAHWTLLPGALISGIFGMDFAYGTESWISHGLFLFGQSLVFYGGILFIIALWPSKELSENTETSDFSIKGISLESANIIITAVAILISVALGGIAGANFGMVDPATGKTWLPILAESAVRSDLSNVGWSFKEMVVSHLHIMLALLAGMVMLLSMRYVDMKGKAAAWANILYTPGVIILSVGAWLVITPWEYAHVVINVGAGFLLMVGAIIAIYGWRTIAIEKLGLEYSNATLTSKLTSIFKDPVKFGLYFQLVWVNIVSTFPGVFVAINLDERYRTEAYTEIEYSFNVGHWHILATLIGVMVLLMITDEFNIQGAYRIVIGWTATIGSIVGFGAALVYILRTPATPEGSILIQMLIIDLGLGFLFFGIIALSSWMVLRLVQRSTYDSGGSK